MDAAEVAAVLLVLRFPEHHRDEAARRLTGKRWQPLVEVVGDQDGES